MLENVGKCWKMLENVEKYSVQEIKGTFALQLSGKKFQTNRLHNHER